MSSDGFQNSDSLLEAPRINNNLSKSSEACYGYLDDYMPTTRTEADIYGCESNAEFSPRPGDKTITASTVVSSTTSMMRSHSDNNIENLNSPLETASKLTTGDCIDNNHQQVESSFLDSPQQHQQYQFYG